MIDAMAEPPALDAPVAGLSDADALAKAWLLELLAARPLTEADRNGRIAYGFGHIPAGQSLIFFMSLQVNPTNVGRRSQNVELDDGETPILTIHRTVTIFP